MQGSEPRSFQAVEDTYDPSATDQAPIDAVPTTVCVAVWAGRDMHAPVVHPPYNLMLRLLMALCPDIIIPVSREAARVFNANAQPYRTGKGVSKDYTVHSWDSSASAVQVCP